MKKQLLLIFLLPLFVHAQTRVITTCVGAGTAGYTGNGGSALAAEINSPGMVSTDSAGNLYFSDIENNVVRKVSATGIISTIAGCDTNGHSGDNGLAISAKLSNPLGVVTDHAGNIYIADLGNSVVRKVTATGIITTIAGTGVQGLLGDGGPATSAQLNQPSGLAIDRSGNLIIADEFNSAIRKLNFSTGKITTIAGILDSPGYTGNGGPATSAKIGDVVGISIDHTGNMYIAESFSQHIVRKIDTAGIITLVAGDDSASYTGDGMPARATNIDAPGVVAVDDSGNVYFSCQFANVVRKVNAAGILSTYAGNYTAGFSGDGGLPTAAKLNQPLGITIDNAGNMYIAELDNNRIRKIGASTLGVTNIEESTIALFPNPATTILTITSPDKITQITITNLLGQTVYCELPTVHCQPIKVNVVSFPAGIYFVRVNDSMVRKFVKS